MYCFGDGVKDAPAAWYGIRPAKFNSRASESDFPQRNLAIFVKIRLFRNALGNGDLDR